MPIMMPSHLVLIAITIITLSLAVAAGAEECAVAIAEERDDPPPEHLPPLLRLVRRLHTGEFYVNGTWVEPLLDADDDDSPPASTILVVDPSDGRPLASVARAGPLDADRAVAAARDALPSWSIHTTPAERRSYLERLLDLYVERGEDLALLVSAEMGAPIDAARSSQVGAGAHALRTTLDALDAFEFERTVPGVGGDRGETAILAEPVGVVAMITPWNWPLYQIALKVAPALAVGCTCVLKPSELSPLSALLFAELVHDAGIPPGVFNLVLGDGPGSGASLAGHPGVDAVSFTGSTRAGASVSAAASDSFKRLSLEMGGKGANVIFSDVGDDLGRYVEDGVSACFDNSGQNCDAPCRMLVERSVYDAAVEMAREAAEEWEVGSAHESGDHLGPVAGRRQFDAVRRRMLAGIEEGARLVAGGPGRPEGAGNDRGFYVKPTVFADCEPTMSVMREEIFGPVLCVAPFDSEGEAAEIANGTPYGLANYVQSSDGARRRRMARLLRSGVVEMNGIGQDDGFPFGGVKASGIGREGGVYGLEEFCEVKAVTGYWVND